MSNEEPYMTMTSNDARIKMRDALDAVGRDIHVIITRYGRDQAVMVPPEFYEQALDLMVRYGTNK